ncbi:Nse1 non-SMC component of SMC5-6 complex-domain-containing protein [Scheffersomyces coipomensis]|uniref:Nse1 non-SMC component of SMC5-6 complex-domain-containing protein n=1 Tax=Scheffersomyces coipomensis TaxID=1788519 RepID=UPI00315DABE3
MNEIQRVLLTYIRGERYIDQSRLINAYNVIFEKLKSENEEVNDPTNEVEKHITAINSRISEHGFKVERRNHEITGELNYIFVNTLSDEVSKSSTTYSAPELDAIKSIIDDIIEAENYSFSIGRVNCHQKVAAKLNKTLGESSAFVDRLIDDGWFICTSNDRVAVSIKAITELKAYLITRHGTNKDKNSPGKILQCDQCDQILTMGYMEKRDEPAFFHYRCFEVYKRTNEVHDSILQIGIEPETV